VRVTLHGPPQQQARSEASQHIKVPHRWLEHAVSAHGCSGVVHHANLWATHSPRAFTQGQNMQCMQCSQQAVGPHPKHHRLDTAYMHTQHSYAARVTTRLQCTTPAVSPPRQHGKVSHLPVILLNACMIIYTLCQACCYPGPGALGGSGAAAARQPPNMTCQ
jgi:hypothetical protein